MSRPCGMVAVTAAALLLAAVAAATAAVAPEAAAAALRQHPRRALHNLPKRSPTPPLPSPIPTCTTGVPPGYTVPCSNLTRQEGCESCQSTYPTPVVWACCGCKRGYAFNDTTSFANVLGFCEACPAGQSSNGGTSRCVAAGPCAPGEGGVPCAPCRPGRYSAGGQHAACEKVPACKVPINCKRGRQGCSSTRNAKNGTVCSKGTDPQSHCVNGVCTPVQ